MRTIRTCLRAVVCGVSRTPFTVGFLLLLWLIGFLSDTVFSGPRGELRSVAGFGAPSLVHGHWWSVASSLLWADGLPQYLVVTVAVAVLGGLAERRIGTGRMALAFLTTYVLGALLSLGTLRILAAFGDTWAQHMQSSVVVAPSAAAFGASLAASSALPPVWCRRLRLTLLLAMAMLTLYIGFLQDLIRLYAGFCGLVLGPLIVPRGEQPARVAPSRVEARLLIAMMVAASAIGPMVATASRAPDGPPLSVLQYLVSAPQPTLSDMAMVCADPAMSLYCEQMRAALRLDGPGPAFLSIIPVLILLVMAEGLRRGRRFAWWSTLVVNVGLIALGWLMMPSYIVGEPNPISTHDWADVAVPLLEPVLVIGLLLMHRRTFDVDAPRGTYRRLGIVTSSTLAACAVVYTIGAHLVRNQFDHPPTVYQILLDLPLRFAPPGYLGEFPITFLPIGTLAEVLYEWTGVAFWLVALSGCAMTFLRARVESHATDRDRARALLNRHGGMSTSHMITWPGNSYWFSTDGHAVVAYRVISAVALTTGEPVGAPNRRQDACAEFARFSRSNGWTPCFYGVTEDLLGEVGTGWSAAQIAEEAILPLSELEFRGKKFQDVRTALNKAKALGITVHRFRYRDAPQQIASQIRALSREWLANRGLPEMGFTLGTVEELTDDDVWCVVAVDDSSTLHGVTSWLPARREGEIIGWTLDLMRRTTSGFPGVMELLIASMALQCRAEGAEFLSLSGAPLARLDRGERPIAVQRLLDFVGWTLEPVYGFRSLLAFKAKFQPRYRPLFMSYPDAAALPSIGNAVAHAYLQTMTLQQSIRLLTIVLSHAARSSTSARKPVS
jgi:lysylphosphatidylglycerol synthetase-like protein (DUF2156 family)